MTASNASSRVHPNTVLRSAGLLTGKMHGTVIDALIWRSALRMPLIFGAVFGCTHASTLKVNSFDIGAFRGKDGGR
jgi:hypothetical protein